MKIVQKFSQLEELGIHNVNRIYWQLNTPQLYEEAVQRHEGFVAHLGPLVVRTGNDTGLTYKDRYVVREPATQSTISWGEDNRPFDPDQFDRLLERMGIYFRGLDAFVQDCYVRVDRNDMLPIRMVTETAWHNLFVRNTFFHATPEELPDFVPAYTLIHAPHFRALPEHDGTHSHVFIIIHMTRRLILIGGTSYAGEIKKAILTVLNYLLPRRDVLPMLAAANQGDNNEVALFLGHSGTGKSILAADPTRMLIGDSVHGWGDAGIFNVERGCYPKVIGLSEKDAPEVFDTTRRFGTILENVAISADDRRLDLNDAAFTSNTRASYPVTHLQRALEEGVGRHPEHIFLLTNDVFGVLPPISKLTPEQAQYHYRMGYTGELVQNSNGELEPRAAFGSCYGALFMPLHPGEYADLFIRKVRAHNVNVWLLNTGWTGGPYGQGKRIRLAQSRAIVSAVFNGCFKDAEFEVEPHFGLAFPTHCPDIPDIMLNPQAAWPDEAHYNAQAHKLTGWFDQMQSQYHNEVDPALLTVHPEVG